MSCEHVRSAIGAYALGALDPDEAAAVRRHLEVCADCAAEHDALAPLPGLLSLAGGAQKAGPPPGRGGGGARGSPWGGGFGRRPPRGFRGCWAPRGGGRPPPVRSAPT